MLQIPKPKKFELHPLVWTPVIGNPILLNSTYGRLGITVMLNQVIDARRNYKLQNTNKNESVIRKITTEVIV